MPYRRAALAAAAVVGCVIVAVTWPVVLHAGTHYTPSPFGMLHAWTADLLWRVLSAGEAPSPTCEAGYPWRRTALYIGWAPIVASWALRPLLGPIAAWQVVMWLSLPVTAAAGVAMLRRFTDASPLVCAALGAAWACAPFFLGVFGTGEVPNLQGGLLVAFLIGADRSLLGERGGRPLLAIAAVATPLTSPYFGLSLPFLLVGMACVRVRLAGLRRLVATLVTGAVAMGVAFVPFVGGNPTPQRNLFRPAMPSGEIDALYRTHNAASLRELFVGHPPIDDPLRNADHVAYLGWPLLLGGLALAVTGRGPARGRAVGVALLVGGALLAMGPELALVDRSLGVPLPGKVLTALSSVWQRADGWYRFSALASLGLSVWVAAEATRRRRHGAVIVAGLAAVQIADAVRATRPWPRPIAPVPAREILEAVPRDDGGAVLFLPLEPGKHDATRRMLVATVAGRPIEALTRSMNPREFGAVAAFWQARLDAADPARALREAGVRLVVRDEDEGDAAVRGLGERLPPPIGRADGLVVHDLGPTSPRCMPVGAMHRRVP